MRRIFLTTAVWASSGILAACGSDADPFNGRASDVGSVAQQAGIYSTDSAWRWPNGHVDVCFFSGTYNSIVYQAPPAANKTRVQQALTGSWAQIANISFTFYDSCNGLPQSVLNTGYVQLMMGPETNWIVSGATSPSGYTSPGVHYVTVDYCDVSNPANNCTYAVEQERAATMHEFGHVLGFTHTQEQSNRPADLFTWCTWSSGSPIMGTPITLYDPPSVMNYCHDSSGQHPPIVPPDRPGGVQGELADNAEVDKLSALDVIGAQILYGAKGGAPTLHLSAGFNVNGGWLASTGGTVVPEWYSTGALASNFASPSWKSDGASINNGSTLALPVAQLTAGTHDVRISFLDPYARPVTAQQSIEVSPAKHAALLTSAGVPL